MAIKFCGTFTVMVTAFDNNGRIDLDAQARFTEWQVGFNRRVSLNVIFGKESYSRVRN